VRKIKPEEIVTFSGRMGQGMCQRLVQKCNRRQAKILLKKVKITETR